MDTIDTKREWVEEILANRMLTRLPQIIWGDNCSSVKEALTFPEDWLLQDFSSEKKKDVYEYLSNSSNGFKVKWSAIAGRVIRRWTIPEKPTGVMLEVMVQYQNSYYLAIRDLEEKAESALIRFLDYRQSVLVEKTENVLYQEILVKKIDECNKSYALPVRKARNIWFMNPERMKINYTLTSSGSYLYASKGTDISAYVYDQERRFNENVGNVLGFFFSACTRYFFNRFDDSKNTKYLKTYMQTRCFKVIKELLEPCGFFFESMPQDAENKYKEIGFKTPSDIPVYITLHKVKYIYREELSREFNLTLQRICEQIKSLG